jgi:hypothetical protein
LTPDFAALVLGDPAGGSAVLRQLVATWKATGIVAENVIQPAFSDQARPLKIPVVGPILTPHDGSPPHVAGAKSIQPEFSDQARPESAPQPSLATP